MPSKEVLEWIDEALRAGVWFSVGFIDGGEAAIAWEHIDVFIKDKAQYWSIVLDIPKNLVEAFMRYRQTMGRSDEFRCQHIERNRTRCKNEIFIGQASLEEFCRIYPIGLCQLHRQLNSRSSEVTT